MRMPAGCKGAAVAALATAVLLLVGCGDSGNDEDSNAAGGGTLVVWDFLFSANPDWKANLEKADASFEEAHAGVTVKHVAQPSDNAQYTTLVKTAIASGNAPDVLLQQPSNQGVLNLQANFLDLRDKVSSDELDQYIGLEASTGEGGGVFGLPTGTQGYVIFYNKKVFRQAGLDPDSPPTTIAALSEAAATLKAKGFTGISSGNKEGTTNSLMFGMFWPAFRTADDLVALEKGDLKFSDPRTMGVLQPYLDMVKEGAFSSDAQSTPFASYQDEFTGGKSGMVAALATNAKALGAAIGPKNLGVVFAFGPDGGGAPAFQPAGPALEWSVAKASKKQDLAVEYVKHVTGAEVSKAMLDSFYWLPSRKDVPPTDVDDPAVKTLVSTYAEQPTSLLWSLRLPPAVTGEMTQQVNAVIFGDRSLEAAMKAVDAKHVKSR